MGAFRLRNPSGGSSLRGTDSLRGVATAVGVTITVDKILGGVGNQSNATDTSGFAVLVSPLGPATGTGRGTSATFGVGLFISATQAAATGLGSTPTLQDILRPATASASGLGSTSFATVTQRPTTAAAEGDGSFAEVFAGVIVSAPTAWEVRVYDLNSTTPRLTFVPVQDWSFGYVLNGPGAFEATLSLTNPNVTEQNLRAGQREIRVYRNSTLVWGGYLWQTDVSLRDYSVRIMGEGYYSRLRRRYVMHDLIFDNTAQEDIAWSLIRGTQQDGVSDPTDASAPVPPAGWTAWGDLKLTRGTDSGPSQQRDRDYCAAQHPNVGDSLDELSQLDDGFDFCITPTPAIAANKQWMTFAPRKQNDTGINLGGNKLMTVDYTIDASDATSREITTGSGDCNPPEDDRTNYTSLQNFGLLEDITDVQFSNLSDVQAHGKEQLRNTRSSRWQATVTMEETNAPAWGRIDIGDTVNLQASGVGGRNFGGFDNVSMPMRVIEMNVAFQKEFADAFTTLTLDSVIAA